MRRRSSDRNDVVTPERFVSRPRARQLDYAVLENQNFFKIHGPPNAREDAYLILSEVMAFSAASHKN